MDNNHAKTSLMARRENSRRAMSLLELTIVVAILGLLSVASITRFGHSTLANGNAEGFARKLSLALVYARRSSISTGVNHFVRLSGNINRFTLYGFNAAIDEPEYVPEGVTVTSSIAALEFDFEGAALGAYSVDIVGPNRSWNVSTVILTGAVRMVETTP